MSQLSPAVLNDRHDGLKYSETVMSDPSISSESEGGWISSRPRFTRRSPKVHNLFFTDLSNAEKIEIEDLYNNLRGSSDYIVDWLHPVSRQPIDVRFKKDAIPQFNYTGHGGNHRWNISNIMLEEL